jgi:hypothetical protein
MNNFNKIHIYLRQFSKNRKNPDRPEWFNYEKTFLNLLITINRNISDLTICFERECDYPFYFTNKYKDFGFKIKFIDTKNIVRNTQFNEPWSHSVAATSEIIKNDINLGNINDNSLIYILEDDYLHLQNWNEIVLDLFNNFIGKNDYVCLYDHNDKYIFRQNSETITQHNLEKHWGMYKDLKSEIMVSNARHWRNAPNCGLSMIFTKELFLRDFNLWSGGYSDCEIGYQLKKIHNTNFWTPMPSVSTHCINPFIAPLINWEKISEETKII